MDVRTAIEQRRSVRAFARTPVPQELLDQVLEAAVSAPSANNGRPWHIVVVRDEPTRRRLAAVHQWAGFAAQAPVNLVMCGDRRLSETFWIEDCSAAVENMLLTAHAVGLASCWIAIRDDTDDNQQAVRAMLGIPEHVGVLALLPLGYPQSPPTPRAARPAGPHVHLERW